MQFARNGRWLVAGAVSLPAVREDIDELAEAIHQGHGWRQFYR